MTGGTSVTFYFFFFSCFQVSGFGGSSLFYELNQSIADQLAHFPTGPAGDDKFWILLITWHLGLFVSMTLGCIGVNGRKQGYW